MIEIGNLYVHFFMIFVYLFILISIYLSHRDIFFIPWIKKNDKKTFFFLFFIISIYPIETFFLHKKKTDCMAKMGKIIYIKEIWNL